MSTSAKSVDCAGVKVTKQDEVRESGRYVLNPPCTTKKRKSKVEKIEVEVEK